MNCPAGLPPSCAPARARRWRPWPAPPAPNQPRASPGPRRPAAVLARAAPGLGWAEIAMAAPPLAATCSILVRRAPIQARMGGSGGGRARRRRRLLVWTLYGWNLARLRRDRQLKGAHVAEILARQEPKGI
jgi:hypothetical protein